VLGRVQLDGLAQHGLGCDRVVVLVDEPALGDLVRGDRPLRHDSDGAVPQQRLDKLLDAVSHGVRLDEEEGLVGREVGRVLKRVSAQLLRLLEHRADGEVLESVKHGHHVPVPHVHLRVLGPLADSIAADSGGDDGPGGLVGVE